MCCATVCSNAKPKLTPFHIISFPVRNALEESGSNIYSDDCREKVTAIIKSSYDEAAERETILQLARDARRRGQKIVFERFGHVGHILGGLFASSKIVTSFDDLLEYSQCLAAGLPQK